MKRYRYNFYNKTLVIHLKHASWLHMRSHYSKYANEDESDDELYLSRLEKPETLPVFKPENKFKRNMLEKS